MSKKITINEESRKILKDAFFKGGARFYISENDTVYLENENGDVSPNAVGGALAYLMCYKEKFDPSTVISFSEWNIDGLDESNFGLLRKNVKAYQNYGDIVVCYDNSEDKNITVSVDDDQLNIAMYDYTIQINGDHVNEYVFNDRLDFDAFIASFEENFTDNEKKAIFEKMDALLSETLYSKEVKKDIGSVEVSIGLFDAMRWGKDEIYRLAEQEFGKSGVELEIDEMEATPVKINGEEVVYLFVPTSYKLLNQEQQLFSDSTNENNGAEPSRDESLSRRVGQ